VSSLTFVLPIVIVAVVVLVGFAIRRGQRSIHAALSSGDEPFTMVAVSQAFDPDYAILWDTQFPALHLVEQAGRHGLPLKCLLMWYADSTLRYPELYDGSSFGGWLEYLQREGLVKRKGRHIIITSEGQEFLHYRIATKAAIAA